MGFQRFERRSTNGTGGVPSSKVPKVVRNTSLRFRSGRRPRTGESTSTREITVRQHDVGRTSVGESDARDQRCCRDLDRTYSGPAIRNESRITIVDHVVGDEQADRRVGLDCRIGFWTARAHRATFSPMLEDIIDYRIPRSVQMASRFRKVHSRQSSSRRTPHRGCCTSAHDHRRG